MKNRVAGLILAAGYSSRMGRFKPLLPIGTKPALEIIMDSYKGAGIPDVFVVTGFKNRELADLLEKESATEIYNNQFDEGMFSSIQIGVKVLDFQNFQGVLLGLADCPLPSKETMEAILERANQEEGFGEDIIIPCYQGKKGHPIYIPNRYLQEIGAYKGPMGLKGFMNLHRTRLVLLETKDEAVVLDMDDQSGYEEILDFHQRKQGFSEVLEQEVDGLRVLLGNRRLLLIRHCEQVQVGEKIFLGQVDLPLSVEGRASAKEIGKELKRYNINTDRLYTSDLMRARQTADLIKEFLVEEDPEKRISVTENKAFREINLGCWDGKTIREIREKFPEAYVERGKNLLGYKVDASSENFYDLKYRVLKEMKKMLRSPGGEDLVLVTHSGVIHCILSSFNEISLEDQLKCKVERGTICLVQNREDLK